MTERYFESKPNVTPGFDNINSYIQARDARNTWFRKAALRPVAQTDPYRPCKEAGSAWS